MQQREGDKAPLIRGLIAVSLLVLVGVVGDLVGWWDVPDFWFGT